MLLKIELSWITSFFYNNFFNFGGGRSLCSPLAAPMLFSQARCGNIPSFSPSRYLRKRAQYFQYNTLQLSQLEERRNEKCFSQQPPTTRMFSQQTATSQEQEGCNRQFFMAYSGCPQLSTHSEFPIWTPAARPRLAQVSATSNAAQTYTNCICYL